MDLCVKLEIEKIVVSLDLEETWEENIGQFVLEGANFVYLEVFETTLLVFLWFFHPSHSGNREMTEVNLSLDHSIASPSSILFLIQRDGKQFSRLIWPYFSSLLLKTKGVNRRI